jgi:hypothetical protein
MQTLIPIAYRNLLPKRIRYALIKISHCLEIFIQQVTFPIYTAT